MEDSSEIINTGIDFSKTQADEDEALEFLKLKKEHAHVFKLPPMSSSEGHVANDFVELIFKGTMKMTLKGEMMIIYFLNPNNTVFLVSLIDENVERFVIPVRDSVRYFSIKAINDKGQAGWYGLAFKQRNDSFDFKVTLQNFKQSIEFERNVKNQEFKPKYDFSLKAEKKEDEPEKKSNFGK